MAQISPLRRRMIEDMTVRNLSPATQQSYLNAVSKFSRYFSRSPDRLGLEDVHAFQVHLVATGISWPALNQIVCALRFFYGVTLNQDTVPERIAFRPGRKNGGTLIAGRRRRTKGWHTAISRLEIFDAEEVRAVGPHIKVLEERNVLRRLPRSGVGGGGQVVVSDDIVVHDEQGRRFLRSLCWQWLRRFL